MNSLNALRNYTLGVMILLVWSAAGWAQTPPTTTPQTTAVTDHDGQHDFDFEFGHWKMHNRRLLHPLSHSTQWVEFEGDLVARPIWGGRANMDIVEADSPTGHIEGMTVRTYNTKSHQWSIYWANQANGTFSLPATVGYFNNGIGQFYDQEDWNGRNIFVRFLWIVTNPESPRWEQAFSVDGGKTWETNWIVNFTRESHEADGAQ